MTTNSNESNLNNNSEQQQRFPGYFAIDFGTSNSTVTLFDPKEVDESGFLPKEQKTKLFQLLADWLSSPANKALPGVDPREWENFIGEISQSLEVSPSVLHEVFKGDSTQRCLEAIRQIELCLGNSERFRKAVSKKLYQIYHHVFRIPTLASQNLIPVVLNIDSGATEIPSELEITGLSPLKVMMGTDVNRNKQNAIRDKDKQNTAQGESSSLEEIKSKFHHSPKRYFGQEQEFQVSLDGKPEKITVNHLIQAAWGHLIDLTKNYRERGRRKFSQGEFQAAVVTYPTVAPPIVRKQVKELVQGLGIKDVQTAYDEAVAVVMFYLWREFGGYFNIGIESFKTRCRQKDGEWSQNVLVLDIGGGTTDIALIKLTLSDITPSFKNDPERGLGGRYYQITPKLLGSSGHLQLGGELITLRVFRLLKVAIVDRLLSAIATGELNNQKLSDLIPNLNERFVEDSKYKQGSLLKCIDKLRPEDDSNAYKDALDTAEKVLPTRWQGTENLPSQRFQTFYILWEYAERAKLELGKKPPVNDSGLTFTLSEQEISELLNQVYTSEANEPSISKINVTLNSKQFERAAYSVIKESVAIAKGLMESRLADENPTTNNDNDTQQDATEQNNTEQDGNEQDDTKQDDKKPQKAEEKVDWLILSGKTCNLDLVEREIYQQFSESYYFLWNPERITFDSQFTKQGTSAGACYAEKMRQLKFSPQDAKPLLHRGANQLRIDVKNLFYYLPCNFKRKTQTNDLLEIFKAGTALKQISPDDEVAKVRAKWSGIQLTNIIYRQDYEGGQLQLWGSFDGNKLLEQFKQWKPNINESWFENNIKIQFEIDSGLNIGILLCQGEPHYLIDGDGIDVKKETQDNEPSTQEKVLLEQDKFGWDIAVNVLESAAVDNSDAYHLVFKANDNTNNLKKFHYNKDTNKDTTQQPLDGLISEALPDFPESGKHTFYVSHLDPKTNDKKWLRIGQLEKPNLDTQFPCEYRVSLDERGILRIHAGEVPYRQSENEENLKEEGWVFRTELELQPNEVNIERDPFSGTH